MLNVKRSFSTHGGMTHAQVAAVLGVSKQRVQQIEIRAIRKLRAAMGSSYDGPIGPFLQDVCGVPELSGHDREG